jgi:pyridoxal phosphate enzyme (YggS family)
MTEKSSAESAVRQNLMRIEEEIQAACDRVGRRREEVTLMGVTKTVDPERINAALGAGVRCIGENRVQEFLSKRDQLELTGVEAHLIGHLQTNKVRQIVGKVSMIQSVDSLRVAGAISEASQRLKGDPSAVDVVRETGMTPILVEVNIGGEAAKSGVAPQDLEKVLEELSSLSGIQVRGLMTVPPIFDTEAEKRQVFSNMYKLFIDIRAKNRDNGVMDILSMGMSGDYTQAILEGSTMVRIGSALFGQRTYPTT